MQWRKWLVVLACAPMVTACGGGGDDSPAPVIQRLCPQAIDYNTVFTGGSGSGGSPAPGVGGSITFPGSGPFGITSMTPAAVDVAGGTVVTITGAALPADPRVRVGASATATARLSSTTGEGATRASSP